MTEKLYYLNIINSYKGLQDLRVTDPNIYNLFFPPYHSCLVEKKPNFTFGNCLEMIFTKKNFREIKKKFEKAKQEDQKKYLAKKAREKAAKEAREAKLIQERKERKERADKQRLNQISAVSGSIQFFNVFRIWRL